MTDQRPDLREIVSVLDMEAADLRRLGFPVEEADALAGAAYFMRTIELAGDRGRQYLKTVITALREKHGKPEGFASYPFLEHVYDFNPSVYRCAIACAEAALRFRAFDHPDKTRCAICCEAALDSIALIDKDLGGFRLLERRRQVPRQRRLAA